MLRITNMIWWRNKLFLKDIFCTEGYWKKVAEKCLKSSLSMVWSTYFNIVTHGRKQSVPYDRGGKHVVSVEMLAETSSSAAQNDKNPCPHLNSRGPIVSCNARRWLNWQHSITPHLANLQKHVLVSISALVLQTKFSWLIANCQLAKQHVLWHCWFLSSTSNP